jgi:hypothetical protein
VTPWHCRCRPAAPLNSITSRLTDVDVVPWLRPRRTDYDFSPGCFHQGSLPGGGEGGICVVAVGCCVAGDG